MIDSDLLAKVALFERLDDAERGVLTAAARHQRLGRGETLFHEGEPGDALFVVQAGAVELFVKDLVGQKIVLKTVKRGDVFGELSLLDEGARTATALSLEESELIVVDRPLLLQLFRSRPDAALDMLAVLGAMTRNADALLRTRVARNANEEASEQITTIEMVADWIAAFSGSMPFLIGNAVWFGGWILGHAIDALHFDPYPYGLLTMIVSLEAIFLSCFVLLAANRQAAKERIRSDIEYEVNVKAELEVTHLHEKTDRLREDVLGRLGRLEKGLAALMARGGDGPRPPPSN